MPIDQPPPAVAPAVVVTAELPPAPGDAAFSIVSVDPPILKISDRLDDALSTVPGFSLFRRISSLGANPTIQGVSLRDIAGSAASRALVTLDGVPQNDPFGGWVIWTGLPPETIGSASVIRGAGAGPYGAGALEGVVALAEPDEVPGGVAGEVEGGSLGYARAAGIAEAATPAGALFLDASGERSDGWTPVDQGRGAVDRPLRLRDWSAGERLESEAGDVAIVERIAAFQDQRGAGTLYAGTEASGAQGSLTFVKQPADGALGWRLQGWATGSNLVSRAAAVAPDRDAASLSDDEYATPAVGVGLNGALRSTGPGWSWEVGADARNDDGESKDDLFAKGAEIGTRTSGGGEWISGLYAEGSRALGAWLVTGGARIDGWGNYDSQLVESGRTSAQSYPPDVGGAVPSGRLGVRRDLAPWLYARAAAYTGFRPATLNELHRQGQQGNNIMEANPALSPERLYGAEAGVGGQGPLTWDADAFVNRLADAVTNVTIGHGPGFFPIVGFVPAGGILYRRENVGAIDAWGVEADGAWQPAPALDLQAGVSWTHARVDGGEAAPQLTGKLPALTPAVAATADAVWRPIARLTLVGEARYEGPRWADDLNTLRIAGGAELDAEIRYAVTVDLTAFLAADNVLNADLETGHSLPDVITIDAPRLVRVGVAFRR